MSAATEQRFLFRPRQVEGGRWLPQREPSVAGPANERRADAIERANRAEALRNSDLQQFHLCLDDRQNELDATKAALRKAEEEIERLKRVVALSQSASGLESLRKNMNELEQALWRCKADVRDGR